jgi:hypothetical protein
MHTFETFQQGLLKTIKNSFRRPLPADIEQAFLSTPRHVFINKCYEPRGEEWELVEINEENLALKLPQLYQNIPLTLVVDEDNTVPATISQPSLVLSMDIAITSDPIKDTKIKYIELFQDEMVAVVSGNHPWTDKKFVEAEDFRTEHLLIHSLPLETVTVHQYLLAPAGVSPQKITPLPLTEASLEMVKADMGIMVMAKWAQTKTSCKMKSIYNGLFDKRMYGG